MIDELRPGDWVLSWDEDTGAISERAVTEYYQREVPAIIDIFIGVEKISCSTEHPFWVDGQGWVLAHQLMSGSVLTTLEGASLNVDVVHRRDEVTQVFNVEIDGAHTYFVSDLEILAHNVCKLKPHPDAKGQHTTFKYDNETGEIRSYETFKPQTNPRNPNPWESEKRVDLKGKPHFNKETKEWVPTPHVNEQNIPGNVRPARLDEIPVN